MNTRLFAILVAAVLGWNAAASNAQEPESRQATRDEKLAAARQLMGSNANAALVTIDSDGFPRVRTVEPFPPEDDWTIWVATNPLTRKVTQIKDNGEVALYYKDDDAGSYVSITGIATIHDDAESKAAKKHRLIGLFWPDYPDGYLLISVKPAWLEVVTLEIAPDRITWQPQIVRFDE